MRRIALVTGAAQGLGHAIAERLGHDGAVVVLADVQLEAAERAAHAMRVSGIECYALPLDIASEESVREIFGEMERRFGRLDILVNNAGVGGDEKGRRVMIEEMSFETWQRTLRVNLTGGFLMCRGAVPLMRHGGFGRIVNISSRAARARAAVGMGSYAASKAAILGLSRVLAGEVGRNGITVNCVAPSSVVTAMTLAGAAGQADYFERKAADSPLGRIALPADIADAVAFLCSDHAGFITGFVLDVNGGTFMS